MKYNKQVDLEQMAKRARSAAAEGQQGRAEYADIEDVELTAGSASTTQADADEDLEEVAEASGPGLRD